MQFGKFGKNSESDKSNDIVSITIFTITTLSITTLSLYAECCDTECHNAEYHKLSVMGQCLRQGDKHFRGGIANISKNGLFHIQQYFLSVNEMAKPSFKKEKQLY